MSCITLGATVRVLPLVGAEAEPLHGRVVGIDETGRLVLEQADGDRRAIAAGEVRRVRPAPAPDRTAQEERS